jgi:hypothetical protein
MDRIKIIEKRPIAHPAICKKIVRIFAKRQLKISVEEARHLWDLHGVKNGFGWMVKEGRTEQDIFEAFEPYYIVDAS